MIPFLKFFAGGDNERWLGEGGILPVAGYVVVSVTLYVWMRQRGQSWRALAREALRCRNNPAPSSVVHRPGPASKPSASGSISVCLLASALTRGSFASLAP